MSGYQSRHSGSQNKQNEWEELSDHENMIDENDIEPDYFIDRANDAVFIPDEEGNNKANQIEDRDDDLFDFETEVEVILQVLCGKALELARIEVIEEQECTDLAKQKQQYKKVKEAELIETQRMEATRFRKTNETDRRNLQLRTSNAVRVAADKKVAARNTSKNFLGLLKKNTLGIMNDLGLLRKRQEYQMNYNYVPTLLG